MDKLRVYYDRTGNTLSVWFDDPKKEYLGARIRIDVRPPLVGGVAEGVLGAGAARGTGDPEPAPRRPQAPIEEVKALPQPDPSGPRRGDRRSGVGRGDWRNRRAAGKQALGSPRLWDGGAVRFRFSHWDHLEYCDAERVVQVSGECRTLRACRNGRRRPSSYSRLATRLTDFRASTPRPREPAAERDVRRKIQRQLAV